jgi:hypothetical protein
LLEPRPYTEFDAGSPESLEAMAHVRALLGFIGDDPEREGLVDTPKRVVKAMNEHFWGYRADPTEPLRRTFSEVEGYDELVLLQDMEIQSHCEHHMVPFVGKAHVAYIPNGRVVGPTLLVCPMSVVGNWNRELHRFAPEGILFEARGDDVPKLRPYGDVAGFALRDGEGPERGAAWQLVTARRGFDVIVGAL